MCLHREVGAQLNKAPAAHEKPMNFSAETSEETEGRGSRIGEEEERVGEAFM
jgi:hypothetical protein